MESLKMIIEVIEESIGLDKLKEQFCSVSLMLDLMFDHGLPLLTSKPFLVQFLQMPAPGHHSLLNKAASLLTSNTAASYSSVIEQALKESNMNTEHALWRWSNASQSGNNNNNST